MSAIFPRCLLLLLALCLAACTTVPIPPATVVPIVQPPRPAPRIALALGGGAARGFAHIGVIKALEAQGIQLDIIACTSAGAAVGALYAAGNNGFELQMIALQMQESEVSDWSLPDRGIFKGDALQNFINRAVNNRSLEKLKRQIGVVATDLHSGEMIVFRTGNTGMAVRASSSVPGVFQPVSINGREYVDGGLVSPVPVRVARAMGADFVIAVDISAKPQYGKTESSIDVWLQSFAIMQQSVSRNELGEANVVVRPSLPDIKRTDFQDRNIAILAGEQAVAAILPELKAKLQALREAP
ncbi:NTE family protein [Georgfuchsia toluolica]|uniref:NTE family protein n=1 Tax=Georgfuchsia toluolica TaxID=424218 RepID=A0A916J375_9PROT|nr:patatin-like phospholipase family protein [Georgfuchsia toluolica]CAG4882431.1 NTE family protein [Georgfuchsia toluolica]